MDEKSFFSKSTFNQKVIFFAMGALMAIFSIYLTSHYFEAKYPTGLEAGSICNINSFFNCDATTLSPLGNIAGIPISIFGILIGAFVMLYYIWRNDELEGTLYTILGVNLLGCLILFVYSLAVLRHLCPMCTLYYICSGAAFYILHKNSETKQMSFKYLAIYGVLTFAVAGSSYGMIQNWEKKHASQGAQLVKMYHELNNLGNPSKPSPHRLASATKSFEDAPIQLSVFSDFQCPACKAINKVLPHLETKYKGKINIQYFFYPLDHNCNPNMQRPLHAQACKAAYIASCVAAEEFHTVHDKIFDNQENLSNEWLDNYAKELNVVECADDPKTKQAVVDMINQADTFGVRSTPTTLLNGVKIEGVRPVSDYYAIMDDLLKRAAK